MPPVTWAINFRRRSNASMQCLEHRPKGDVCAMDGFLGLTCLVYDSTVERSTVRIKYL